MLSMGYELICCLGFTIFFFFKAHRTFFSLSNHLRTPSFLIVSTIIITIKCFLVNGWRKLSFWLSAVTDGWPAHSSICSTVAEFMYLLRDSQFWQYLLLSSTMALQHFGAFQLPRASISRCLHSSTRSLTNRKSSLLFAE